MISSAAKDYSILAKKANPPWIPAERRLETQGGCADDRVKRRPQWSCSHLGVLAPGDQGRGQDHGEARPESDVAEQVGTVQVSAQAGEDDEDGEAEASANAGPSADADDLGRGMVVQHGVLLWGVCRVLIERGRGRIDRLADLENDTQSLATPHPVSGRFLRVSGRFLRDGVPHEPFASADRAGQQDLDEARVLLAKHLLEELDEHLGLTVHLLLLFGHLFLPVESPIIGYD